METFIYRSFSLPSELCDDIEINNDLISLLTNENVIHLEKYKNFIHYRKCYNYNIVPLISYQLSSYKLFSLNEINYKNNVITIWALEDGEITFWKDHIIQVKKGDIVIFPNSWTFPFEMNLKFIS